MQVIFLPSYVFMLLKRQMALKKSIISFYQALITQKLRTINDFDINICDICWEGFWIYLEEIALLIAKLKLEKHYFIVVRKSLKPPDSPQNLHRFKVLSKHVTFSCIKERKCTLTFHYRVAVDPNASAVESGWWFFLDLPRQTFTDH